MGSASKVAFWLLIGDIVLLTLIGGRPVEDPYLLVGQLGSFFYFAYFLALFPLASYLEGRTIYKNV